MESTLQMEIVLTPNDLTGIRTAARLDGRAGKELRDAALRLIFQGDREGWEHMKRKWMVADE